jgi:hypothetical protein
LFDPEFLDAEFLAEPLRPEQVAATFLHGHYVVVSYSGTNHLLFAPDATAVRPICAHIALIEQASPLASRASAQGIHVVTDFHQAATFTLVDDLIERVAPTGASDTLKPGSVTHIINLRSALLLYFEATPVSLSKKL